MNVALVASAYNISPQAVFHQAYRAFYRKVEGIETANEHYNLWVSNGVIPIYVWWYCNKEVKRETYR